MSVEGHPEFEKEQQHLEFVKRYIQAVIKTGNEDEDQFKANIKEAFVDLDWFDSSLSYINILTNARLLETNQKQLENLRQIQAKPYFAKVQLEREGQNEEYYISKTSLYQRESQDPILIDWRSPLANVYYDGRIGNVNYEVNGEEREAYLALKRQFMIENGELQSIRDIDLTTTDELLQESLEGSAGSRLTEIVSTIQEEQNRVIRSDLNKPIIVQGAAGSGKTTIALHRISYFIYQYAENFDPEKLMILAPNHVFLDYISEALPELGVERINQTTLTDYVQQAIGKNLTIIHNKDLESLSQLNDEETNQLKYLSNLKGSSFFKSIINNFINDLIPTFIPDEDFKVDKFKLYSTRRIERLFRDDYSYLPLYKRMNKIKNVIKQDFKQKQKKMTEKVETFYDEKLEKAIYSMTDETKRKETVSKLITRKEQRMKELETAIKGATQRYFKNFPNKGLMTYYKQLWEDPKKLALYSDGHLSEEDAEALAKHTLKQIRKNQFETEDLALLLILHDKLYGVEPDYKMNKVIIDEAQDYSPIQFIALRDAMDTQLFTIVGDIAQGIYGFQGIENWDELIQDILPKSNYHELQKSYRNTIEIMDVANTVVDQLAIDIPKVEPVVRHGKKPTFTTINKANDLVNPILQEQQANQDQNLQSFAVIAKTQADCQGIYYALSPHTKTQLIQDPNERMDQEAIMIIPSYLSKGLEFDSVFVVSINDEFNNHDETDIKLLYVSLTRPLHRLHLFAPKQASLMLNNYSFN
ncbi:RNA polymerase recycling motor HelD [Alkalibacillus salilacus]|uniref:DNA helicase-2/ATP-dependent DNA helicase PcrA n=1 Tax=Alkalibacillus salilacus TaxID=284582 RepID=A0ABT9VEB5_9BACI|nr:RNA polymerase recycling motor HelD [Alkalibacillus salilacus]MDQ0159309.1 DNA helicase-2/ATP-dependent DNA helicase PcrA [Alkalibacillus salilacus]